VRFMTGGEPSPRTVRGGRNIYGTVVGILLLQSRFPRIPGDVGNASTWPFPVQFRVVDGATPDRVVRHLSHDDLGPFLDAARDLVATGAELISTGCGFLVLFQGDLQRELGVPVVTSSLLQVPWVAALLPPGQAVGILTIERSSLMPAHLAAAGITQDLPVVISGLDGSQFAREILGDEETLDVATARAEHVAAATAMVREHPSIGAFVLECTNMPPYAADIAAATGRPVYDLTTMVTWAATAARRSPFDGYL
jgi:Asp/Glu/hydantoin racemase